MSPLVLHVTQCLSRGGAGRELVTTAAELVARGAGTHRLLSLEPPAEQMVALAEARGMGVVADRADPACVRSELEAADIVQVHFWNTPELYEFLGGDLPPMRMVVRCATGGDMPPHVLTRELVEFADMTIATSPRAATYVGLPVPTIPAPLDRERFHSFKPRPHNGFRVGYIGTVDFAKMHPRYVEMSARIRVPGVRFVVCGSGDGFAALAQRARELGVRDRFELCGFVEDVASVFAELDVFGYPLCEDNGASSEIVVQEAMYAGVPAVVLPFGPTHLIKHGVTGIVAADEHEYAVAIEALHADPALRRRLGRAAHTHARANCLPQAAADRWDGIYRELLRAPKRARTWPARSYTAATATPGAACFVASLGASAGPFATSLDSTDEATLLAAERAIGGSSPAMANPGGGGVLHYRRRYGDDPWLRLWSGLILERQGRPALAAGEFSAVLRLGLEHWRVHAYLARAARALGQIQLAEREASRLPRPLSEAAAGVLEMNLAGIA